MANFCYKQGRVYNLYSVDITDYNDLPNDFLVCTTLCNSDSEFSAQFPGVPIRVKPTPVATIVPPLSSEALLQNVGTLNPEQLKSFQGGPTMHKPTPEAYKSTSQQIGAINGALEVQDKAIQEFKILLARHFANPKDERNRLATEAVGNFILRLWPDLKGVLGACKNDFEEPGFKL